MHKYIHPGYAKHLKCINIVKINKGNSPINISFKVAKVKKKKYKRLFASNDLFACNKAIYWMNAILA